MTRRTAAVALAGFCAFLTLYAPQPLLPILAREFRTSATGISLLLTASTVGVALAAAFAGILADHIGRKQVIVPAALLLAFPSLFLAQSTTLNGLIFWRLWQGVFTPGIAVVVPAYINEEWELGVGSAMGAYVSGTVVGGFSGRIIAGFVASRFSWRASFVVLGAIGAAGAAAVWAWLPPGRRFARAPSTANPLRSMGDHLKNPRLIATYAVGFCVLFSMLATFTYVNFYLAAPPYRLTPAELGLLFVVYLAGAIVTPFAGRWIDRTGHRATLVVAYAGAIGGILLTLVPSIPVIMAGLALCCSAVFVAQACSNSYIGTVASQARAAALGLYVLFYYIGGSAGSAAPGYFWNTGGWPACVALIVGVQIVTITLASFFWKPASRPAPVAA